MTLFCIESTEKKKNSRFSDTRFGKLTCQFCQIIILMTFITALGLARGESFYSYEDSPCEDYDYRQQYKATCENWSSKTLVDNILYDDNGEIDITVAFIFWISLTSIGFVIVFQKLTSEHVLSGKCMAKKKSGEGYCSKDQLPGKLYCKMHLEENRFRFKKQN